MSEVVKGRVYAVPDEHNSRGFHFHADLGPETDMSTHGWVIVHRFEFPFDLPQESVEIMVKGIENAKATVQAQAYKRVQELNDAQMRLQGIAYKPVEPKEEQEVEAEEAEVVEEPKREDWYFTFGGGHMYPNGYVKVSDATYGEARAAMKAHHGSEWAFQYNWADFEPQIEKYGLRNVLVLTRDGDFDDEIPF